MVELATRLDAERFEPAVYCLAPRPQGNPTSLADVLETAGVPVTYLGARSPAGLPLVVWRLAHRWRRTRPAVVQSFLFHANIAAALAARRAGILHAIAGIRVAERRHAWHLTLARWVDPLVERYVCVSRGVREFSLRAGRLPDEKLTVIPNGVDVSRFDGVVACSPQSIGVGAGQRVLCAIGRLDRQKFPPWFLPKMADVLNSFADCELVIVGDGPLRRDLEWSASQLGAVSKRIHLIGYRRDVPQILAASSALVAPSLWEGMSNALLEAMASARPVMANRVEGVDEALGNLAASQTFEGPQHLVSRLSALLRDRVLAAEIGRENRLRVAEEFSLARMVSAYEQLYERVVSGAAER